MAYTETRTVSYGSRLGNSFKGIGTGFVMLIIGTILLWWNEGNFVKTEKMLEEAQGACVHVEDVTKVDPEYEGQLIHAIAPTSTKDSLSDPMFKVGAVCVKLSRDVEYYQWVENKHEEHRDKVGGGEEIITTYTYEQKWVSSPESSASFKEAGHTNTVKITGIDDESEIAENVKFGGYDLPGFLISQISGFKDLDINLPADQVIDLSKRAGGSSVLSNGVAAQEVNDTTAAAPANLAETNMIHQQGNVLYIGRNSGSPEVGDMRITFKYVTAPKAASVIAKTQGETFAKFVAKNGKTLSVLSVGSHSMEEMFQTEHDNNSLLTWVLRIIGVLLIIGAFKSIFGILYMLFKVLPFLADIVEMGVGLVAGILGIAWSLIIIALAWIWYRPVIGCIILAIVVGLIAYGVMSGKKAKAAKPAVEPAPAQ
ncbi:MAG: TMEM43 family protein [Bacteroidaceae bacterium]|nr:TMEM43 family protein [Bacteroidaceae bacterium]